ncbi:MAG: hypothetical protein FJY85_11155 [Deltaproteobacteria bacterium]|nr:hypothetical protein [Deltaproteobacteria bacterium]
MALSEKIHWHGIRFLIASPFLTPLTGNQTKPIQPAGRRFTMSASCLTAGNFTIETQQTTDEDPLIAGLNTREACLQEALSNLGARLVLHSDVYPDNRFILAMATTLVKKKMLFSAMKSERISVELLERVG